MGITHSTSPDDSFSNPAGRNAWTAEHTITESGGQALTVGAITDGQFLKRSGTTITSGTAGSSDIVAASAPNSSHDLTTGGLGGAVTIISESVTGVVALDQVVLEAWVTILNNSGGATITYTHIVSLGTVSVTAAPASGQGAHATNRSSRQFKASIAVTSSSSASAQVSELGGNSVAANAASNAGVNFSCQGWATSTNDATGTQTFTWTITPSGAAGTQTLTLHSWVLRKIASA